MKKTEWCEIEVSIHEGRSDGKFNLGDELPFLTAGESIKGLEIAIPVWQLDKKGERELVIVGVNLNDLVTGLIETEIALDREEATKVRKQAISALKYAVSRLEKEPLQIEE